MDSEQLLAREEEFKKLNRQLEKKTVSLMKEIENVMQKQDIFAEFSPSLLTSKRETKHCTPPPNETPTKSKSIETTEVPKKEMNIICGCCSPKSNVDLDFFHAFVVVNVQDKVLPQSFLRDRATVEGVCKFLASKAKLMQEQMDRVQSSLDCKVKQCEGHLTQIAEFESEKLKLLNSCNNLKSISSDMKAKSMALQNRLDEKDRLYKGQRSESDSLSSEVKRLRSKNANVEAKCISQEQEIDRLKQQIEGMKVAEKDFKASTRSLSASHTSAISRLEAKIRSLTSIIDKQRSLTENLRQQNAILTSEIMLKGLEKEYCEFLTKD